MKENDELFRVLLLEAFNTQADCAAYIHDSGYIQCVYYLVCGQIKGKTGGLSGIYTCGQVVYISGIYTCGQVVYVY